MLQLNALAALCLPCAEGWNAVPKKTELPLPQAAHPRWVFPPGQEKLAIWSEQVQLWELRGQKRSFSSFCVVVVANRRSPGLDAGAGRPWEGEAQAGLELRAGALEDQVRGGEVSMQVQALPAQRTWAPSPALSFLALSPWTSGFPFLSSVHSPKGQLSPTHRGVLPRS